MDQILNNAATIRHMSGNQFGCPVVIRMATGAGRQLAAQHSHSLEGWYAHIPGIRVLAPATLEDARGMLWTALQEPDPVLIFENVMLYNRTGQIAADAAAVDIDKAAVRREGRDISLITYGGSLWKTLEAAEALAKDGIDAEVIDSALAAAARRCHDHGFGPEDAPGGDRRRRLEERLARRGGRHADHGAGLLRPGCADRAGVQRRSPDPLRPPPRGGRDPAGGPHRRRRQGRPRPRLIDAMAEFRMPSLGADMEAGTLVEWLKKPGEAVKRGDIVAVVETQKGAIEIEIFEDGVLDRYLVEPGVEGPGRRAAGDDPKARRSAGRRRRLFRCR